MEYIYEIAWFTLWPVVIYLGYKMTLKNVSKYEEKLSN
jgi:hypothetical protein